MSRPFPMSLAAVLALATLAPARGDDEKAEASTAKAGSASFMKDVAPILVQHCIACHNPRKSESKYVMTTFAQFAKGGQQGEGINIEPGDPDASFLVELIRPDGQPRMPYKLDPLPPEKVATIERWIKGGAEYDGNNPTEDWVTLLHKLTPVVVPESYPATVPITALAFTPDHAEIAAAGYHELNIYKTADGTLSRRVRGPGERTYDIAYSPDGRWLATASGDPGQFGSAKLWKVEPDGDVKPVRELVESTDSLYAVAFSPDSKLIAAAGADRAIRIQEVESGRERGLIEDHADWILDLAFSPDGKRLASASRDKTSKVFDVEKRESLVTFPGHAETVYCVGFSPDGKQVATGGADNQVRIWNPDDEGKPIRALTGFGGPVFRLLYHPDGKALIACGSDKVVRVFDPVKGNQLRALQGHADWIYSLALSTDGKTIASGSWDGEVRLWNLSDGKPGPTILAAPGFKPAGNAQASAK